MECEGTTRSATFAGVRSARADLLPAPTPVALRIRKIKEDPRATRHCSAQRSRRLTEPAEDCRGAEFAPRRAAPLDHARVRKRRVIDTVRNEIPLSRYRETKSSLSLVSRS